MSAILRTRFLLVRLFIRASACVVKPPSLIEAVTVLFVAYEKFATGGLSPDDVRRQHPEGPTEPSCRPAMSRARHASRSSRGLDLGIRDRIQSRIRYADG